MTRLAPPPTAPKRLQRFRPFGEPVPALAPPNGHRQRDRSTWLDPLLLGTLAALVSSVGSWIPSKWNDEAATQTAASRSLAQLWQMMHNVDAVHGVYYAFMHFWIMAVGTSNFAMRAPSIIATGTACAGIVLLGRRLGNRRIAICSALAFLILPRVTWMAIEARSDAFTALVAVWLTVVLLRAVDGHRTAWWALYSVVAAVGISLNLYLALLVVSHGVALMISRRRHPGSRRLLILWGISAALSAVAAAPIVALALGQTRQLPFATPTPTGIANTLLIGQYFVGATPTYGRGVPVPPTSLWAAAALVLSCVGWSLMIAAVVRGRAHPRVSGNQTIGLIPLAVCWIVLPVVLIIGYSLVVTPMYTARYFSFTTPAVALLIGTALAAIPRQWQRIVAIAALALIALPIFLSQRGPTSKNDADWQQAAAVLQSRAKPGQDIYYGPIRTGSTLSTSKVRYAYPAVLDRLHDITLRRTGVQNGALWDSQWPLAHASSVLRTTPLLWVVLSHYGRPSPASTPQLKYIESEGLRLDRSWRGSSTDVLLFAR